MAKLTFWDPGLTFILAYKTEEASTPQKWDGEETGWWKIVSHLVSKWIVFSLWLRALTYRPVYSYFKLRCVMKAVKRTPQDR